jgi:hypothetical protein
MNSRRQFPDPTILTRAGCVMGLRAPVELPLGMKTATNSAAPNNSAAPAGVSVLVQRPERRPVAGSGERRSREQGTANPEIWVASRSRRAGPLGLAKATAQCGVAASIGAAPHRSYSETAWASGDRQTGASFRANSVSPTSSTLAGRAPPTRNRRSYSSG